MRVRALPFRLAVPATLVVLVVILGTLQYRWLGQVSEAERERLQKSVRAQAQAFADAFDAELLWIHLALQEGGPVWPEEPEAFARRFDAWREKAAYPQIVRAIYLHAPEKAGPALQEYRPAERRFVAAAWPPALEAVRARLADGGIPRPPAQGLPHLPMLREPIVASVPALIIPVATLHAPTVLTPARAAAGLGFADRSLIVQLDLDAIRASMIPALAAQHLPAGGAEPYRVAIEEADNRSRVVFSRGLSAGSTIDPRRSDAAVPLFALRFDLAPRVTPRLGILDAHVEARSSTTAAREPGTGAPPAGLPGGTTTGTFAIYIQSNSANGDLQSRVAKRDVVRITARASGAGAWRLVLQHPAGSLDVAVARARSRNAWLGFGILAVLAASVGLVVLNAQRAERLARQQIDFVATVSHELRTPLAVIRSAAQNLSAGVVDDPERTRHYGEMIDTEGRRLTEMVEQILEYAGLSSGKRPEGAALVDVASLVHDVVEASLPLLDAQGIEVAIDLPDDLPAVRGDERGLARAVTNLVTNAAKHGAEGRWIGISARRRSPRHGRGAVEMTVSDRGPGIPPSDLPHVFEPFYRGRHAIEQQVPGNGLGLSLVKRIVEACGGRVSVKSTPQGSAFTLSLPAAADQAAAETVAQERLGDA